ncbi:hypothetical protein BH10CYA1_BH10CYA1_63750 [soil metagenome]
MGTVLAFIRPRAPAAKPVSWGQVTADSDEFCSYCLMLLQQLDLVRIGHTIDLPKQVPVASINRAQVALKERGYPTNFHEGGESGFGYLYFL